MTIMMRRQIIAIAAVAALAAPAAAAAQTRLTLADALRLATEKSEAIAAAKANEVRADAEIQRADSLALPQVSFVGSYDRTLASEFSSAFESTGTGCTPLTVNTGSPVADRVTELERAVSCGGGGVGSGIDFSTLPFGQTNVYRGTLAISQALYTGGRITAQKTQARLGRRAAELTLSAVEAQTALEITRAFYDVALSEKLVAIAESAYQQAESAFAQAKLAFDAGRQPEFELLRAQVARDNQRPVMIRRRADREVAMLRLRQLLELPPGEALIIDVDIDGDVLAPPAPFAEALSAHRAAATADIAAGRTDVKQAETLVGVRETEIKIARAERLPSVSFSSSLGRVGYPSEGVVPRAGDFRTNWTAGASVSVPLFTGYRLRAGERVARADLVGAQARLKQTRELAELDAATALQDLSAAEAVWEASAGTIQQAERAYQIAELRNREGLSTQLELSDSRLSLQVAQANRAQAARDVQVARARVALLTSEPVRSSA